MQPARAVRGHKFEEFKVLWVSVVKIFALPVLYATLHFVLVGVRRVFGKVCEVGLLGETARVRVLECGVCGEKT